MALGVLLLGGAAAPSAQQPAASGGQRAGGPVPTIEDRGQGGQGRVNIFQRVGTRVMLVQGNQTFRSSAKNPLERKAVEDSFAKSVLWGFAVAAESNGRVLVDATDR